MNTQPEARAAPPQETIYGKTGERMATQQKKRFPSVRDVLRNLDYYIAAVCMLLVTTYCFINVISRFLIGKTSAELDELNIIVFIWFLYASITYCVRMDKHIRVEFLDSYISEKSKTILRIIADTVWIVFSIYITYAGLQLILFNTKFIARTSMLQIPVFITYSIIFISFFAMSVFLARNIYSNFKHLQQLMRHKGDLI
ncbi:TRAP transporter small permease [uncultured Desulfovibrio sp.]|uniref:TRAP transporter small permease n=2 Tax=uncultured Desulfovibrio sp. TaxID=167968 RepID=UPI00261458B5|nr:TRAP transporter small permease [uncultured Desulfovibrio sp.]